MFEQFKHKYGKEFLNRINVKALEVGIGNDSPTIFKSIFPNVDYFGVDRDLNYNLSEKSLDLIDKFYQVDLGKKSLDEIPDDFFDYVIIAHVIEHIENGEEVISELTKKIKPGGGIYIEYPREASAKFPSMKGTLNFYDDPTHKRFYELRSLEKILTKSGFEIIRSGIKRDFTRIIGIPYMIIKSYFKLGYLRGSVFWDLLGFAEYILAKKK